MPSITLELVKTSKEKRRVWRRKSHASCPKRQEYRQKPSIYSLRRMSLRMWLSEENCYQNLKSRNHEEEHRLCAGSLSHAGRSGRQHDRRKVNWVLVGHVGIIGHDRVLVSLHKSHHTNKGIRQTGRLSINIVVEDLLQKRIT